MPPLPKTCPKMVSAPRKGMAFLRKTFLKKIFRYGRRFNCRRLRSAAVTRLWPRGLRSRRRWGSRYSAKGVGSWRRRSTAATWPRCNAARFFPALGSKHHYTRAEFVAVRRLSTRRTSSIASITRARKSVEYGLGIDCPSESNQCRQTHSLTSLGNPPDSTRPKHALAPIIRGSRRLAMQARRISRVDGG
jgi:hypothetical protein